MSLGSSRSRHAAGLRGQEALLERPALTRRARCRRPRRSPVIHGVSRSVALIFRGPARVAPRRREPRARPPCRAARRRGRSATRARSRRPRSPSMRSPNRSIAAAACGPDGAFEQPRVAAAGVQSDLGEPGVEARRRGAHYPDVAGEREVEAGADRRRRSPPRPSGGCSRAPRGSRRRCCAHVAGSRSRSSSSAAHRRRGSTRRHPSRTQAANR